jgi:hypothetical protein
MKGGMAKVAWRLAYTGGRAARAGGAADGVPAMPGAAIADVVEAELRAPQRLFTH